MYEKEQLEISKKLYYYIYIYVYKLQFYCDITNIHVLIYNL
jgi:hypothetical protein